MKKNLLFLSLGMLFVGTSTFSNHITKEKAQEIINQSPWKPIDYTENDLQEAVDVMNQELGTLTAIPKLKFIHHMSALDGSTTLQHAATHIDLILQYNPSFAKVFEFIKALSSIKTPKNEFVTQSSFFSTAENPIEYVEGHSHNYLQIEIAITAKNEQAWSTILPLLVKHCVEDQFCDENSTNIATPYIEQLHALAVSNSEDFEVECSCRKYQYPLN